MENTQSKELSIADIILSLKKWIKYLCSKWKVICVCTIVATIIGLSIFYFSKPKFVAESNFVLEGASASGGLGAAIGITGDGSTGLFSTVDNIIWMYKSEQILRRTLLTTVKYEEGQDKLLINEFILTSKFIHDRFEKTPSLKKIKFEINQDINKLSIEQEGLIKTCIRILKKEYINASTINKTENIVNVKMIAENELFAYHFIKTLVTIGNDYYIQTKTKKALENVEKLEIRADSLKRTMDKSILKTATNIDDVPYLNPNLNVLKVEYKKSNVDVQANTTMYLQVVQNLEIARNELTKETPIIQVVDEPILPLSIDKPNLLLILGISLFLSLFLSAAILIVRKLYKDAILDIE